MTTDARISELYRDAAGEDSPRHLDLALMAAARERVTPPRPAKHRRWITWQVPFAAAALGILSVSVVTLMMDEGADRVGRLQGQPDRSPPPRGAATEARPTPSRAAPAEPQAQPERAPERSDTQKRSAPMTAYPGATAPPEQPQERAPREAAAARDDAAAGAAAPASSDVAQYSAAPAAPAPAVSPARGRLQSETAVAEERAATPSAAARPAPALRAGPQLHRQKTGAGASPAPRSHEVERHVRELEGEDSRVWLERIQGLWREGRAAEAKELLAEFKRRFPGEALPIELR